MNIFINFFSLIAIIFVIFLMSCSHNGKMSEHQSKQKESKNEHSQRERGEHTRDKGGDAEGEESGIEFSLTDRYDNVRHGARLVLAYDKISNSFIGTVENTTNKVLERVRVEVHLSNGKELGPTAPHDLKVGEKRTITLKAKSTNFNGWSAHPEVGNNEHGHANEGKGEGGHGKEKRGEHN